MNRNYIPQLADCSVPLPEETVSDRRLYSAMIMRAVEDLTDLPSVPKVDRRDPRYNPYTWIMDNDEETLSFRWCCMQLDLDPDAVRERVSKLKISPFWLKR